MALDIRVFPPLHSLCGEGFGAHRLESGCRSKAELTERMMETRATVPSKENFRHLSPILPLSFPFLFESQNSSRGGRELLHALVHSLCYKPGLKWAL